MALSHRFLPGLTGFATLAVTVAAASCGGTDATPGPGGTVQDSGAPDVVAADTSPPVPTCAAPKTSCGTACVDLGSDGKNCGACGTACAGAEVCVASKCTVASAFAARKVYLGETDRTGMSVQNAWKQYGRNIDGITTVTATDGFECKRIGGASAAAMADGNDGIDNSWGKNVLGFLLGLVPTPTKSTNQLIEAGGRTPLFSFATPPKANGVAPFALVTAESTIAPKWDGSDSRPIAESSTAGGKPKTTFATAAFAAGVLTSGDATAPFVISFSLGGTAFEIPIRLAQVTMTLAADGKTATTGTVSGVIDTEELVTSFAKSAGALSQQLCAGSTLDTIKQTLRQASDILIDGTQDPTKDCNAISIGVGFDAVLVAAGPVAGPVAPAKDPCAP
ncbi:hypothetical protein BH11MYX4_BH11MYX4_14550 [soil metagenome]